MSDKLIIQAIEPNKLIMTAEGAELVISPIEQVLSMGIAKPIGGGEANAAANVGGGSGEVFRDVIGGVINLRTLVGIGGIAVTVNGDTIEFEGSGTVTENIVDPTPADDAFAIGTFWVNTVLGTAYILVDDTPATAVWVLITYVHPNHTGDVTSVGDGAQTIAPLAVNDAKVAAANKDGLPAVPSMRTLGVGAQQATAGDDARLSDSRPPNGAAGGGLAGTYPNPTVIGLTAGVLANDSAHGNRGGGALHADVIPAGASGFMTGANATKLDGIADGANNYAHPNHTGDVTSVGDGAQTIAPLAVTDAKVAAANKDGLVGVPSMRTLGTGAQQAAAGNDARLSDARIPTGPAGGALGGTYPNPTSTRPITWSIENPLTGDRFGYYYTSQALTVTELRAVIEPQTPPGVPSVTWSVRFAADRSAAGTGIQTVDTVTTDTTTGDLATIDTSLIPAGSWVWLQITTATTLLDAPAEFGVTLTPTVG